ncbi:helix-turn-helix domain-containing protein [Agrobacterium vitis]|uniref:YdaS family helix-turn-helix protein n=1 Tax=Agrobacterium vitis TaxID=373 RepID=UPI0012E87986|nr:YdaS family helix-turn-helix protein [Agrobacterium vitis]MVA47269.1 helix-turn-helix domain-containing protein [Agrobacterium vitis]
MALKKPGTYPLSKGFLDAVKKCGSATALANRIGVTQQLLSLVSRGQQRISGELAIKISVETGVSLTELIPDRFEKSANRGKTGVSMPPKRRA